VVIVSDVLSFGCIFRCLDPILTIAASMSVRNPFIVPFDKRDEVDEIRRRFTPYQSDHLTLLAAYNGWRIAKSKGKGEERAYCARNFLSMQTLTMIYEMKKQLAVLLAEIGFLHRAHQSDIMQPNDPVNQHAGNVRLVEAVIVAGLYPHIARLDATGATDRDRAGGGRGGRGGGGRDDRPQRPKWMVREGEVAMHPSSVLFNEHGGFDSPFMVFHEKVKTTKVYVRDATIVGSYALLLFGVDMCVQHEKSIVILDDWLSFKIKPRTAALVADLRLELRKLLVEKIQCPTADLGGSTQTTKHATSTTEENEARAELRRIGPASMLQPQASGLSSNPTSGLAGSLQPGAGLLKDAPDLISVVAMLLAEEEHGRKKRRAGAQETPASTSAATANAAGETHQGPGAAAQTATATAAR
jgi:HrpA-like RNA helicase